MSKATAAAPNKDAAHSGPWWRHPYMWLVVGGPAVVVVAGFVTLYLAIRSPDYVYKDEPHHGSAAGQASAASASLGRKNTGAALAPAMQARNHAATGGLAWSEEPNASAASSAAQKP